MSQFKLGALVRQAAGGHVYRVAREEFFSCLGVTLDSFVGFKRCFGTHQRFALQDITGFFGTQLRPGQHRLPAGFGQQFADAFYQPACRGYQKFHRHQ
ncbi:hypothetical protein [Xenorhabdus bovienii]|uniref:hypothetical protein n=1 Tax=Xenorhabdus bovienii TaxID=40576 RepID=UPI001E5C7A61|nr:hypothetical protein [Xenorhabdus bovienii]